MARKKVKVRKATSQDAHLPEVFAFGVIVFIILILFSTIALVMSVKP